MSTNTAHSLSTYQGESSSSGSAGVADKMRDLVRSKLAEVNEDNFVVS